MRQSTLIFALHDPLDESLTRAWAAAYWPPKVEVDIGKTLGQGAESALRNWAAFWFWNDQITRAGMTLGSLRGPKLVRLISNFCCVVGSPLELGLDGDIDTSRRLRLREAALGVSSLGRRLAVR